MIAVQIRLNVPWLPRENKSAVFEEGCTVEEMLERLGFQREQIEYVLVVINGRHSLPQDLIGDGDFIQVLPVLCGG
jgi:sulfur carrier protein ThiS